MSKIVISGYYGYDNLGDEAILMAIISVFKSINKDIELVILSDSPDITEKRYQVKAINRNKLGELWNEIKECDLFISGGGSLFQDVTSWRSIPYYTGLLFLALFFKKKTVIYAQGIGPVKSKIYRWLIAKIANCCDLVTVRDKCSRELLINWGVKTDHVFLSVDPVFALKELDWSKVNTNRKDPDIINNNFKKNKPLLGVNVRSWSDNTYLESVADAIIEMVKETEGNVLLIPMHLGQDREVCKKLKERVLNRFENSDCSNKLTSYIKIEILEDNYGPVAMLKIYEKLDFLLGVRLHSLIFATLQDVPFVGLEYDPKIKGFIESTGINSGITAGDIGEGMLPRVCKTVWHNRLQFQRVLNKKGNIFCKTAIQNAIKVVNLLEEQE